MTSCIKGLGRTRWIRLAVIVTTALVAVIVALSVTSPQTSVTLASPLAGLGGPQQTNIQISNTSATQTAHVMIRYYDTNGNEITAAMTSDNLGPRQTKIYYQATNPNLPSGFRGSAVVSSDTQVKVVGTEVVSGSPYMSSSYQGISTPATVVYVPLVFNDFSQQWNTRITVQNSDPAATAHVRIVYTAENGTVAYDHTVSIAPNGSVKYDHGDMRAQLDGPQFRGSAVVTSDVPVAVTIDEYSNTVGKLLSYAGIPASDAAKKVYAPLVARKYSANWYTNMMIRNVGDAPTPVRITYRGPGLSGPKTVTYPNVVSSLMVYQYYEDVLPNGFRGSAVIEADQPIVARMQWTQSDQFPSGAYNGFPAGRESTTLVFPNLFKDCGAGHWYSNFVLTTTNGGSANVTVTYYGGDLSSPVVRHYNMNASLQVYQYYEDGLPSGWRGAATVTASTPIVGVAENNPLPGVYTGDALTMYEGITP